MKEIKFRAWNKDQEFMKGVQVLDNRNLEVIYEDDGFFRESRKQGINWDNQADLEVMQYIGLKDKNGREIYEGDIVSYINTAWEVIYDVTHASFLLFDSELNEHLNFWSGTMNERVEVIGNIYENPELLSQFK